MNRSKKPIALSASHRELVNRLLAWFDEHQRDLPWRSDPTPYHVWLSEIMLQQTQVKTVLPYFKRFLAHYPNIEDLAGAPEEEVLDLWAGLGYYSRARNLHKTAKLIRDHHQGIFPSDFKTVLNLPGIGRYSAGAVLSIAFGLPYPVLDGNVKRVLARLACIEDPIDASWTARMWELLEEMVKDPLTSARISEFNQALMELGALVCVPADPRCSECPFEGSCAGRAAGIQKELPRRGTKAKVEQLAFSCAVVEMNRKFLMRRCEGEPFLNGFWEFPKVEGIMFGQEFTKAVRLQHGLDLEWLEVAKPVKHQVTFRKLTFQPVLARFRGSAPDTWEWVDPSSRSHPVSAYIGKVLASVKRLKQS